MKNIEFIIEVKKKIYFQNIRNKSNLMRQYAHIRSTLAKNFKASSLGTVFDAGIQIGDFKYDLRRLISIAIIPIPSLISEYFNDDHLNNQYKLICRNFESVFK